MEAHRRGILDADDMTCVDAMRHGPRQGPQPEWAETRRQAGLGRAGLFRPAW
jgi:hypothetical protein